MNNTKEKFELHGIPYDDLDVEMIGLIDALNFYVGLKTKYCCYGHTSKQNTYVLFDESVTDEQMMDFANRFVTQNNNIWLKKWVRDVGGTLTSNWMLDFSILWHDPNNPAKKAHLDKIAGLLKAQDVKEGTE